MSRYGRGHRDMTQALRNLTGINLVYPAQPRRNTAVPTMKKQTIPSHRRTTCAKCTRVYEILDGSPLLDESAQLWRDIKFGLSPNELDSETECPQCNRSFKCLGWTIIEDMYTDEELKENPFAYNWYCTESDEFDLLDRWGDYIQKFLREIKKTY